MQNYWLLKDDLKDLFNKFPNAKYSEKFGQSNIHLPAIELEHLFNYIKNHKNYPMQMLVDITVVDYLTSDYAENPNLTDREEDLYSETRFDIIYHFFCLSANKRIRIISNCGGEQPEVISSYKWWQAANFLEREVYDMFGIKFKDHPDLRRVLLYEEFEGYPLRKDYPIAKEQPRIEFRDPETDK